MTSFYRNTKRWGKFDFQPEVSTHTLLTAVGYVTVESVIWTIFINESKVLVHPTYGGYSSYPVWRNDSMQGEEIQKLYRRALKSVSPCVRTLKESHAFRRSALKAAGRACGKCVHSRSTSYTAFGIDYASLGPVARGYAREDRYACHRYPISTEVSELQTL